MKPRTRMRTRTRTTATAKTRTRTRTTPKGENAHDVAHNGRCSSYGRACTNAKAGRTREIDFEQIIGYLVQGRTRRRRCRRRGDREKGERIDAWNGEGGEKGKGRAGTRGNEEGWSVVA